MEVELKTIRNRVIVHARRESTRACQRISIESGLQRKRSQFVRCANRVPSTSSAEHQAKFRETWIHAALQCTQNRRCDARRVPVHTHHSAVCLKPEWITQSREEARLPVVQNDLLGDGGPKLCQDRKSTRLNSSHRCISYA